MTVRLEINPQPAPVVQVFESSMPSLTIRPGSSRGLVVTEGQDTRILQVSETPQEVTVVQEVNVLLELQPPSEPLLQVIVGGVTRIGQGGFISAIEDFFPAVEEATSTYTLTNPPAANTLLLFLNGKRLARGAGCDFTLTGQTITLNRKVYPGFIIGAHYQHS